MAMQKLYNAGDRLKETIHYSVKPSDANVNWVAHKLIDAPEKSFFLLEDEVSAPQHGVARVPVYFAVDLARKHGYRGIVLIDPEMATPVDDDTPFALNEEEAQEKGERLWTLHLHKTVQDHIDMCAGIRATGGAPRAATHFTRRAFKLLGLVDPGMTIFQSTVVQSEKKDEAPSKELLELRDMLADVMRKNQILERRVEAQEKVKKDQEIEAKVAEKAKK